MSARSLIAAAGLALVACGSEDPSTTNDTNGADTTTEDLVDARVWPEVVPGDPDVLIGTFTVSLRPPVESEDPSVATAGSTGVLGKIYDGPYPSAVRFAVEASADGCELWVNDLPFCPTSCAPAACVDDDTCQPYPSAIDAGLVTVTGIDDGSGATSFTMKLVAGNYQPTRTPPFPAFSEGDAISVATGGFDVPPFSLTTTAIAELEVLSDDVWVVEGEPIALAWNPPGAAGPATRIEVKLDISHHGGARGFIHCELDDDGAHTIPVDLVDALLDLGVAGLPTIVLTREITGSTVIAAGRVDLVVSSAVELPVSIPGLVSCTHSSQCPEGTTCQDDLSCR